jgi:hypothetical protein
MFHLTSDGEKRTKLGFVTDADAAQPVLEWQNLAKILTA